MTTESTAAMRVMPHWTSDFGRSRRHLEAAVLAPVSGRGCLLCNTAAERAALDAGVARHVDAYLQRLTNAFRHALTNGQHAGDIDERANLDDLAAFFTMALPLATWHPWAVQAGTSRMRPRTSRICTRPAAPTLPRVASMRPTATARMC